MTNITGEKMLTRWVEYSLCEWALEVYPKSKSKSSTFNSFCERIKESIIADTLSKRDVKVLNYITYNTNRQFALSNSELGVICANFFIDNKWERYVKAIKLMKGVNWKLF